MGKATTFGLLVVVFGLGIMVGRVTKTQRQDLSILLTLTASQVAQNLKSEAETNKEIKQFEREQKAEAAAFESGAGVR